MNTQELLDKAPLVLLECAISNTARFLEPYANEYFYHLQDLPQKERIKAMMIDDAACSRSLEDYLKNFQCDVSFSPPDTSLNAFYFYIRCLCAVRVLRELRFSDLDFSIASKPTWAELREWALVKLWKRGRKAEILIYATSFAGKKRKISCVKNRDNVIDEF